jgi:hypothetical protein
MGVLRSAVVALAAGKLVPALVRRLLLTASRIIPLPFGFLVDVGCLERPAHAYCMWHAAQLAQRLGYSGICVAEFGVAGGVTLMILARYAKEIEKATGVRIKVYGFDTGGGLPELEGAEDLPYWFRPSQYSMDVERLLRRLENENAELIIGNVRDTAQDFFTKANRPPLAAVFNDLDLFSSSRDALRILEAGSKNFLPRLFMYLDDVGGGPVEMYGPFNGELAANEMFNREHDHIKIHLNQNLLAHSHLPWRYQIYYIHLFDHPRYREYVGGADQSAIESRLKLQS